ncbi:hypothetical protein SAMN02745885_01346 [Carboxydocella sporoproducens DSM 16521]|uniref:Peptidase MA-like domain-containing protein n=2 Tax=Carboxydocella TaxID=178898 RepID=A0A1T4PM87_9FIRM|nr:MULTISPECIES: hypothetical protein [Carboxydocella]AVX19466.1 hypothetical protein CFE_0267 [Carboxydocella thermautotrophica]AVX29883.1 hypothetical protein CTH_0274 [Carboxydocella thermautotrophica]GAW29055.1 hypothetical protein ULO1_16250 [Carboxydocella sp. ULO1]SJZ92704.1 hypothetical protein SAMN02745885_01346 [Carboxydocella sporoproducens DSM 16521]
MPILDTNLYYWRGLLAGLALCLLGLVLVWWPQPKQGLYLILQQLLKAKLVWETRDWREIEGEHFRIRYQGDAEGADEARLVLQTAEKFYPSLLKKFHISGIEGKTLVVIFPDKDSLNRSFGWGGDQGTMGVYWAGTIRVLAPQQWAQAEEDFVVNGPMAHEFAHLLVDKLTLGNYPRWLTEGIAQQLEYELTGFEFKARSGSHSWYPVEMMDGQFDSLPDQELAYIQARQMVRFMEERYGEKAWRRLLPYLGQGWPFSWAWYKAFGENFADFSRAFISTDQAG